MPEGVGVPVRGDVSIRSPDLLSRVSPSAHGDCELVRGGRDRVAGARRDGGDGRCVLLADHTELGADSFCRFGALSDGDKLVTDRGAEARHVRALRPTAVELLLA